MMAFAGLAVATALTGCAGPDRPSGAPPGPLLRSVPGGFELVAAASADRLPRAAAAEATPADPGDASSRLNRDREQSAASAVWQSSSGNYILDIAFRFATPAGAADFSAFESSAVKDRTTALEPGTTSNTGVFGDPQIPNSSAFVVAGPPRTGSGSIFIEGVVYPVGNQAFLVDTGGPMPASLASAEQLAYDQMVTAEGQTRAREPQVRESNKS